MEFSEAAQLHELQNVYVRFLCQDRIKKLENEYLGKFGITPAEVNPYNVTFVEM